MQVVLAVKKYFANQENINKYCYTTQQNTFLDISYDKFESIDIPDVLKETVELKLQTNLPKIAPIQLNDSLPIYLYNFYNLDPEWDKDVDANRVLLLEPEFFKNYPVCDRTIEFVLALSKNIKNIQVFVGGFDDFMIGKENCQIHFKEHPSAKHYKGVQHKRDWMFEEVNGYYPSFFSYWKKCEKYLDTFCAN